MVTMKEDISQKSIITVAPFRRLTDYDNFRG
jgi:hypothetical protein